MKNTAQKLAVVVPIEHATNLRSKWKRIDSDRLIEKGKNLFQEIQKSEYPPSSLGLSTRISHRCSALLKAKYARDIDLIDVLAHHTAKIVSMLLEKPDQYYGFFDPVVDRAHDAAEMLHSANGCLLTAALYNTPPLLIREPELYEFYARWSVRLFSQLEARSYKFVALQYLAQESHVKNVIAAIVDLYNHPVKI